MNGKLQGIIICGVTAACLVGVMAFLNSTSGKSDADSSSSSTAAVSSQDESVVILTKSSDDITSVKVSNEHGEYSVNKSESQVNPHGAYLSLALSMQMPPQKLP